MQKAREWRPDVVLLDLMLPGMNGFEICRRLRPELPEMWIIVLTARGQEVDRVTGFEVGADDYVTKPFCLRELMARVKVGLRRQQGKARLAIHHFGSIEVDLRGRRVSKAGKKVQEGAAYVDASFAVDLVRQRSRQTCLPVRGGEQ